MKFLIWLVCVIGIEATGIISSLFAGDIAGTYAQMEKQPLLAGSLGSFGRFCMPLWERRCIIDRRQSQSSA